MENTAARGLTSNTLKMIAMIPMTADHLTSVIFPNYPTDIGILFLHTAGRLAAPIFWFFIAEGYYYTRNIKKYIGRMFCLQLFHILHITLLLVYHLFLFRPAFLIRPVSFGDLR